MARKSRRLWVGVGLFFAGFAWASPWDIDMIDAIMFKSYEWVMRPVKAEGAVQRPADDGMRPFPEGYYQADYVAPGDRMAPETASLRSPYGSDAETVAKGKRAFEVTCAPCHGQEGKGGGPVTTNDPSKGINRFPVPAPLLSGAGAVSANRSDGYIYLTIRNGGAIMPAQGPWLTDAERWAVVSYMRTLDGAAYAPPAPAVPEAPPLDGGTQTVGGGAK